MQTVGLDVHHSWELAAVLGAGGALLARSSRSRVRAAGAFARETAVIGFLYGLWQVAGSIATTSRAGAYQRARWIERFEHWLPLPSERSVQHVILGHRLVVGFFDYYYATMHFTTMFIFLIWLFWRHRERYRPVRQVMAWTTFGCLIVQLVPVAPPRMLPGIVDTAMLYHESVYSHGLAIDQLSTMPSVHVAWAVLIGYYCWRISPSRWRYIAPFHSVLMIFVVIATGNHWWLDGIVAVLILSLCAWGVFGVRVGWQAVRRHWAIRRRPLTGSLAPSPRVHIGARIAVAGERIGGVAGIAVRDARSEVNRGSGRSARACPVTAGTPRSPTATRIEGIDAALES